VLAQITGPKCQCFPFIGTTLQLTQSRRMEAQH
jgi:hypothetical protein